MQHDQLNHQQDTSPKRRSSSSFIFPVKSLLGGIQPASVTGSPKGHFADAVTPPHSKMLPFQRQQSDEVGMESSLESNPPGTASEVSEVPTGRAFSVTQTTPPASESLDASFSHFRDHSTKFFSSFRFPSAENSLDASSSFIGHPTATVTSHSPITVEKKLSTPIVEFMISPLAVQPNLDSQIGTMLSPTNLPDDIHNDLVGTEKGWSKNVEAVGASDAWNMDHTMDYPRSAPVPEPERHIFPYNPSEYDFVHLSPILPSDSNGGGSEVSLGSASASITPVPSSLYKNSSGSKLALDDGPLPYVSASDTGISTSVSGSSVGSGVASVADNSYQTTFWHQYAQTENGHHVVIGREGELRRCEDEPIHAPGTVQGFGVLIAIEEMDDTLVVHQVSENATDLLGLSPSYLFSLRCFTETLPDSQACLLWDNIQFLTEPPSNSDEEDSNLHVFSLTGWGEPASALPGERDLGRDHRRTWTCWCAIHRSDTPSRLSGEHSLGLIIMEFELERDTLNPLYPPTSTDPLYPANQSASTGGFEKFSVNDDVGNDVPVKTTPSDGDSPTTESQEESWAPTMEEILESTTSWAKPLPALERLRHTTQKYSNNSDPRRARLRFRQSATLSGVGMMDIFAVMAQINEQFDAAPDLDTFLKVVVGIIKDLTQFHRVLVYRFDEAWNGQVAAELVDWDQTHDLYLGLHFPASDIPAQARALYALNKVRLLYDRTQTTARMVVKDKKALQTPLNMVHCYLRAMSPIHLKYLENMGVRASMSISILAFGQLWGLVACHSYGDHGMRVSFPVRQMLRLLSQAISRNVERLSYAGRLHTRKRINSLISGRQSAEYIISNANDLLGLFDADFGILVIGDGAKILGTDQHGQEILIIAEYLRLKQFTNIQASQVVTADFPDLQLNTGLEVIAGLLYVPLSGSGKDFIALLRRGQKRDVRWAGRPYKNKASEQTSVLEPRKSFRIWCETVAGRCRAWTDEQLETAGVLALVYGKFIEVWRQKETTAEAKKMTNLLLSNASHEVRTPLNHIINYLEMALNGPLDTDTRANLVQSHVASKSLLFTINDLLDLTKLEVGNPTSFSEQFDFHATIWEATLLYRKEAERRKIHFQIDLGDSPQMVVGDAKKIKTIVQNLTANALKHTAAGSISVSCNTSKTTDQFMHPGRTVVETTITDTGCGIPESKLEIIFRQFEQVDSAGRNEIGMGLGLAVVARNVQQLGGQLRVESNPREGSRFSFLIPLVPSSSHPNSEESGASTELMTEQISSLKRKARSQLVKEVVPNPDASWKRGPKSSPKAAGNGGASRSSQKDSPRLDTSQLRILVVEDNEINRAILSKRLRMNGHVVINSTNGQEGVVQVEADQAFDAILMDIQMPLLNGFEATRRIRAFEENQSLTDFEKGTSQHRRLSHELNRRIPIFAVSASLTEKQRGELVDYGLDGWILKPINFERLKILLHGVTNPQQRQRDVYRPGYNWESGGWLKEHN